MSDELHAEYFASRELDERELSRRATDPRAAAAHGEMANHYEAMAKVFSAAAQAETLTA